MAMSKEVGAMMARRRDAEAELNLPPGFRFHPTDDELVQHYLCRKAAGQPLPVPIIAEVDLYKFDPWDLPEKALFGQREWYFFTPRDRKYPNGSRPNRAAGGGYWKATGADKPVAPRGVGRTLGIRKALVFYSGRAPRGVKTDWIMHEYRLADAGRGDKKGSSRLDDFVLCRLYNKKNIYEKMLQNQQQAAAAAEETESSSFHHSPESEIDNNETDLFPELESFLKLPGPASTDQLLVAKKEESDDLWFMDLGLDDLQGSYGGGFVPAPAMPNDNDFFSILPSPRTKGFSMPLF